MMRWALWALVIGIGFAGVVFCAAIAVEQEKRAHDLLVIPRRF